MAPKQRMGLPDLDQIIGALIESWPGSTRSLVVLLRLVFIAVTPLLLVLLWRVTAVLPWTVDGLFAAAACVVFAYLFERE